MAFHVRHNDCLGELFSIGLVSTVVLNFYVKVEGAFTSVDFLTVFVRTDILSIDFLRRSTVMFFPVATLQMF